MTSTINVHLHSNFFYIHSCLGKIKLCNATWLEFAIDYIYLKYGFKHNIVKIVKQKFIMIKNNYIIITMIIIMIMIIIKIIYA